MNEFITIASASNWNLDKITTLIVRIGGILLDLAPALVFASYVVCALVWIFSAGNQKMVKWARDQVIATTVVFFMLAAYFIIKTVILSLAGSGSFG